MGRLKDPIANLLNLSHSYLVVYLDVGLRASDTEATKVTWEVDRMEFVSFIKADVLDRISHAWVPANDRAIKASSEELLLGDIFVDDGFPGEACDGSCHIIILDVEDGIAHEVRVNLERTVEHAHSSKLITLV